MSVHLVKEVVNLKRRILQLSAMVETNVRRAICSVKDLDGRLALEVIAKDDEIDRFEIELEEECLKILALHQPVAFDLRYVTSCMKINSDLERIGDLAVNVAERAAAMAEEKEERCPFDNLFLMMDKSMVMLKESLGSLINMDAEEAAKILAMDDEVDALNREIYREVKKHIRKKPKKTAYYLHVLGVARQFERIADYTTNIAEDVIYMMEGRIVRHRSSLPDKLNDPSEKDPPDELPSEE